MNLGKLNFFSTPDKDEKKFDFFQKKIQPSLADFEDHVNKTAQRNDKNFPKSIDENKISHILGLFKDISNNFYDLENKHITSKNYGKVQNKLKMVESEIVNLGATNQEMQQEVEKINSEMKNIVKSIGLVRPLSSGLTAGFESKTRKMIEDLKKGNPNNPALLRLLDKYSGLVLKVNSKSDPLPLIKNCRETIEGIVDFIDKNPSVFDADTDALYLLSDINNNLETMLENELKSQKIGVNDKIYPIDAFVSLSYLEDRFSDPILHLEKFVITALSDPELAKVKEEYIEVLSALDNKEEVDLVPLQMALLEISDKWKTHAKPLLVVREKVDALFKNREGIDTKGYMKIHRIIAEVSGDKGIVGNLKSFIANQVADNSIISGVLDKITKKIGLSENVGNNNEAIAKKLDPARIFDKQYLAHGEHYDYGANLDSVIDYQLDLLANKVPALKLVMSSIKEPLKALIKEKVGILVEPEHFNAIVAGILDDMTEIVNQLAKGKPPAGYELDIEEFSKQKYDIIANDLIGVISKVNKSEKKPKMWELHKKAANAAVNAAQELLKNEKVKSFLTKKIEKKVNKLMEKTASAVEKGVGKATAKIEKKSKKLSQFESVTAYLDDNTRLDQVLGDFDKYNEQILWDLTAKLIGRVKVELDKADETKAEGSRSPSPTKEASEPAKADITKSYQGLAKSMKDYLLFGPTDVTKQVVYNLVDKYQSRIDPNEIAKKTCESTTKWINAPKPERKKVEKIKNFDKGLLFLANKGYLDAKLAFAEDVIKKEMDKRDLGSSSSGDDSDSGAAIEHLNDALRIAVKPKDIKRALEGLAYVYLYGIGVEKNEKMSEKFAEQLVMLHTKGG
jgi:hypothetical protein